MALAIRSDILILKIISVLIFKFSSGGISFIWVQFSFG